jgi:triacylglycerol lipase
VAKTKQRKRHSPSAFIWALSLLLAACAAQQPAAPSAQAPPPPVPVSEKLAMQTEIEAQSSTVLLMACLSNRAYSIPAAIPACDGLPALAGYTISVPFPVQYRETLGLDKTGEYIIAVNNTTQTQIIAIQGTNSIQDWFANIEITPIVDDALHVPVHRGFQAYARAVQADLGRRRLLNPNYKTLVTGHSLGGAAALLLGLYWYTEVPQEYNVEAVYTFGQPRVFSNRGATSWPYFARRVFRFENCYDFVPLIPTGDTVFASLFPSFLGNEEASSYQHLGQSILLMDAGRYWISGAIDLDRNRLADIKSFIMDYRTKQPIDHSISQYVARIDAMFGPGKSPVAVNPINQFRAVCHPVEPNA